MPDDGHLARRDVELGQEPTTAGDDPDVAGVYREHARRDTLRGAQLRLPLYAGMAGLNSRYELSASAESLLALSALVALVEGDAEAIDS